MILANGYNFCSCGDEGLDHSKSIPSCKGEKYGFCLNLGNDGWKYNPIEEYQGGTLVENANGADVDYRIVNPNYLKELLNDNEVEDYGVIISEHYSIAKLQEIGAEKIDGALTTVIKGCFIVPSELSGFSSSCSSRTEFDLLVEIKNTVFNNSVPCITEHHLEIGEDGKAVASSHFFVKEDSNIAFKTIFQEPYQVRDDKLGFYTTSVYFCHEKNNSIYAFHKSAETVALDPIDGKFKVTATAIADDGTAFTHIDIDSYIHYQNLRYSENNQIEIIAPSSIYLMDYDENDYKEMLGHITESSEMVISEYTDAFFLVIYNLKKQDFFVKDTTEEPKLTVLRTNTNTGEVSRITFDAVSWQDISDESIYTQYLPLDIQEKVIRLFRMTFNGNNQLQIRSTDQFYFEIDNLLELTVAEKRRVVSESGICSKITYKTSELAQFTTFSAKSIGITLTIVIGVGFALILLIVAVSVLIFFALCFKPHKLSEESRCKVYMN